MKNKILSHLCMFSVIFLATWTAYAGDDDSDSFSARFTAEAEYEAARNFKIHISEEVRLSGANIFDRSYTSVGASYRFNDYLKAGISYTAISVYKIKETVTGETTTVSEWYDWRHRVSADITGSYRAGQWKFSLRERIQGTYKTRDLNNYQQPQTAWELRSRLKASYTFRTVPLEPYAYFEPRLLLNGAKWSDDSMTAAWADASFQGHKDVYFNRLRGAAGVEWTLNSRNSFDFYLLYDYLSDKEIDSRKEGSNKGISLKAQSQWMKSSRISAGITYLFSF